MINIKDLELTQEIVRELLDYCPETGELTWKRRAEHWFHDNRAWKIWNTKHAGKVTSTITRDSYGYETIKVTIFGKKYQAHRIVWLYMTGDFPNGCIDHIDRDATNNKWGNLRDVTLMENSKSMSMSSRNKSGVAGVSWDKKRSCWKAQILANGKYCFLGYFAKEDLDVAAMEVLEARAEHGFHPTHGLTQAHYHKGEPT